MIGFLLAEGEAPPVTVGKPPASTSPASSTPAFAMATSLSLPAVSPPSVKMPLAPAVLAAIGTMPRAAGPAARRLARELGIDLNAVFTPDPTGRVLCEDIQRTAKTQRHSVQPVGPAQIATPGPVVGRENSAWTGRNSLEPDATGAFASAMSFRNRWRQQETRPTRPNPRR